MFKLLFHFYFYFFLQHFAASPLLPYPSHSLCSLLLVLLLQSTLLCRVLLHTLSDHLVVLGNVTKKPVQALFDGLVHLFAIAEDC